MFFLVVFDLNVMSRPKTRFLVSFKTLHFQKSPTRKSVVWVFSLFFLSFCYVDTKNRMEKKSLQLKSLLVFVPRDIRVCLCGYG